MASSWFLFFSYHNDARSNTHQMWDLCLFHKWLLTLGMVELEQPEWINVLERKEVCLYTQHFQHHCFQKRSAKLGVAYAVCYFYNTNKISLCVHRLRTHPTLCSKSRTKIMLVIHVLPDTFRLAVRDFVQTHIHLRT